MSDEQTTPENQPENIGAEAPGAGMDMPAEPPVATAEAEVDAEAKKLSQEERDTIGELTNISMGAGVTVLKTLLSQNVDISSPEVIERAPTDAFKDPYDGEEKVMVVVRYINGLSMTTGYIVKVADALKLTSAISGNPSESFGDAEKDDFSNLIMQVMEASSSSIAAVLHQTVEIDTPETMVFSEEVFHQQLPQMTQENYTEIRFNIQLESGDQIPMTQYLVSSQVQNQVEQLLAVEPEKSSLGELSASEIGETDDILVGAGAKVGAGANSEETIMAAGGSNLPSDAMNLDDLGGGSIPSSSALDVDPVTVRPVEFSSFDQQQQIFGEENKNLNLVLDVSLALTVELGKTSIPIKEVLELTRGSVIELDRIAGEPVDLLANGKLIAKGEVVVIEDNFGLRITSIVSPADRLRGM